jgi:hypothetical protein
MQHEKNASKKAHGEPRSSRKAETRRRMGGGTRNNLVGTLYSIVFFLYCVGVPPSSQPPQLTG